MHSTWSNWPGPRRKPVAPKQEQTGLGSGKRSWKTSVHGVPVLRRLHERHLDPEVRWPLTYRLSPGFPSSSPTHRRTAAARCPALRDAVRDTSPRCRRRTRDSPSGWDRPPVASASRMPEWHVLHSRIAERIPVRRRGGNAVRRGCGAIPFRYIILRVFRHN